MNWNKYPFIRLVLALALGVVVYHANWFSVTCDRALFWGLVALLGMAVLLHRLLRSYRYRWVFGVLVVLVFAYVGFCRAWIQDHHGKEISYERLKGAEGWYLARVVEPSVEKEKTFKLILELEGFKGDTVDEPVSGRVVGYFQKTGDTMALAYGDLLAFSVPIEEVDPPGNPGEFDYKRYLEHRGITGMVYLKSGDWKPLGVREANPVFAFAYRFRDRLLSVLRQSGITGDEFGVAAAILLGYDESLPAQVRKNYVAAGSMHILCVSGMHVGIIYLLASFLLSFLGRGKRMARVRKLVLLFLIWFYALLTGLSPSIMRSALMISLLIVGELIHRKGFALNSIAASAFVLLLVDPNHLFAIGFQLSYAAVAGIVLLQKPIGDLLLFKNKLLDKIWEITAVSLAAQIATMPFAIYYFNQFTPYFWLSNVFMTPLSFLVILFGMLLLLVSWVPVMGALLGKLVWMLLHVMNGLVSWVEHLPLSLVKGLYMDDLQFVMSLVLLVLLWLFVALRKKRMMMEMLVLSSFFALTLAWRSQRLSCQSYMVVYSLRSHTAIGFVDGFNSVVLCDRGLWSDPSAVDYSLKGHWAEAQLPMNPPCYALDEEFVNEVAVKRKHLVSSHGLLLAFWDPSMKLDGTSGRITVDYLMVREKQKPDLQSVVDSYSIGMLLIDGSVPSYLAQEWARQAEELRIPCRDVHDGAFFVNL